MIIAIHSYRGGTGKSNISANVSALLASQGARVAVIDTDIHSPGIHAIFGMDRGTMKRSLNDYLWGRCEIEQVAYDLGSPLKVGDGALYLVPSSMNAGEIARILREGYDVGRLNDGLAKLISALRLDYLMIDTHPGLNEETMFSMAIADMMFLVLRPDRQDFQGSAVTLEVARQLDVPKMSLIVNKIPPSSDLAALEKDVETTFRAPVAAMLPLSNEMLVLGSRDLFCRFYAEGPVRAGFENIARRIAESRSTR